MRLQSQRGCWRLRGGNHERLRCRGPLEGVNMGSDMYVCGFHGEERESRLNKKVEELQAQRPTHRPPRGERAAEEAVPHLAQMAWGEAGG
jgi:hypothetical protein